MTQGVDSRGESGDVLERSFRPVHAYALALLGPEHASDAASAAAREAAAMALSELPPERLEAIVRRSTRVAVSRIVKQVGDAEPGSLCDVVPGLFASRTNGELTLDDADRLDRHLEECTRCARLAGRFEAAEVFLTTQSQASPELPHALARDMAGLTAAAASTPRPAAATPAPEPIAEPESPAEPEAEPEPEEPAATAETAVREQPAATDNPWAPREDAVIKLPEQPKKRRWFRRK